MCEAFPKKGEVHRRQECFEIIRGFDCMGREPVSTGLSLFCDAVGRTGVKAWPRVVRLAASFGTFVMDLAVTTELNGPLIRHFRPRAETVTILTFDGSPSGGGATVQLAVQLRADRVKAPISFCWATRWPHDDENLAGASVEAARSQAKKWEAYSLLLAVKTWLPISQVCESQLALCGDALGVLADAMQFRACEPVLIKMMAEWALTIALLALRCPRSMCGRSKTMFATN